MNTVYSVQHDFAFSVKGGVQGAPSKLGAPDERQNSNCEILQLLQKKHQANCTGAKGLLCRSETERKIRQTSTQQTRTVIVRQTEKRQTCRQQTLTHTHSDSHETDRQRKDRHVDNRHTHSDSETNRDGPRQIRMETNRSWTGWRIDTRYKNRDNSGCSLLSWTSLKQFGKFSFSL